MESPIAAARPRVFGMRVDNFGAPSSSSSWLPQPSGPSSSTIPILAVPATKAAAAIRIQPARPQASNAQQSVPASRPVSAKRAPANAPPRAASSGRAREDQRPRNPSAGKASQDENLRSKSAGRTRDASTERRNYITTGGKASSELDGRAAGRPDFYDDVTAAASSALDRDIALGTTALRPLGPLAVGSMHLDSTVAYNAAKRGAESAAWLRAQKEKVN